MNKEMNRARLKIAGLALGLLALGGVAGASFTGYGTFASASPGTVAAQTASDPSKSGTGSTTSDEERYATMLEQNFASRLGVDRAKMDAALQGAVGDTVDQAVKDGKLSQEKATELKAAAGKGLFGLISSAQNGDHVQVAGDATRLDKMGILKAAADKLGLTLDQLTGEMQGGKTLAQVGQAHNVSASDLKTAILAAMRAQMDQAVKDGKLPQEKADAIYNEMSQNVDGILNGHVNPKAGNRSNPGDDRVSQLMTVAQTTAASAMGMTTSQLQDAIKQGQTAAQITQAHGTDVPTLRAKIMAAVQAQADANVRDGKWTQSQATETMQAFTKWLDAQLNGGNGQSK